MGNAWFPALVGGFLILWGGLHAARELGIVNDIGISPWPFFLLLLGAWFLVGAVTGNGPCGPWRVRD